MMSLSDHRRQRFLSVRELAKQAGVSWLTVIDIERGKRTPRYVTMRKIAGALSVSPGDVSEFVAADAHWAVNTPAPPSPPEAE